MQIENSLHFGAKIYIDYFMVGKAYDFYSRVVKNRKRTSESSSE